MKYLIGLIIVFQIFSCKSVPYKNKDFDVLEANKQTIFGGVSGSPVVTIYKMKIKALRNMTFYCDSAWAEGKKSDVLIDVDSFKMASQYTVKKGDTLLIHFEIRSESEMGGGNYQTKIPGSIEEKAPIEVTNGAVMEYKGGKSKYLVFNTITVIETIYAP